MMPRQTRKNLAINGQWADASNTVRHAKTKRPLLRIRHPIPGKILVESRRPTPTSDATLWEMFERRATEYFQSVKIRGSSKTQGDGTKRNPITENRERANYAVIDCTRRLEFIQNENGEVKGILIERGKSGWQTTASRHC